jgi:tetratricopeptide (TPR) repeat protein
MINLAEAYTNLRRHSDAERLLLQSFGISRRVLGEDDSTSLSAMHNLAGVYGSLGRYSEAEDLFKKTLEISRRVPRKEHVLTLGVMNNLGELYLNQREYTKAERLLSEALEILSRVEGEEGPHTLIAMNSLAQAYKGLRRYSEAEDLLEKTLEICRRVRGENHELTLQVMYNLAEAYLLAKRLDRSIPLFEELVSKLLAHFGPADDSTINAMANLGINAMANLGINYRDAGRLPEAIATLARAWELVRKRRGPQADPHDWLPLTRALADAYDRAGQFANSEPLYREALEAERKHHGGASVEASGVLAPLGLNLLKQQKYAEAEPLLRDCLAIREQKQPDDWTTFNTRSLLGGSLLGQKKYA